VPALRLALRHPFRQDQDLDFFGFCGFAGLAVFAFGLFLSTFLVSLGKVLMVVAVAGFLFRKGRFIPRSGLFWVLFGFSAYLLWLSFHVQALFPGTLGEQINGAWDYLGTLVFALLIACLLSFFPRLLDLIPLLVISGFFLGMLHNIPKVSWTGWPLNRPGFGMPFNAFGLYCAVVLLGLSFVGIRWFGAGKSPWYARWRFWVWLAASGFALTGIVLSLSRSAWTACVAVYPLVFFGYYWRTRKGGSSPPMRMLGLGAGILGCLLAVMLAALAPKLINNQRFEDDREAFVKTLTVSEYQPEKLSSYGTRVFLWREGAARWFQRPWTGWGGRQTTFMLEPLWARYPMSHARNFHNTYLEVLVRMGAIGFIFLAAAAALVMRGWLVGLRSGWFAADTAFLILGALLLFAICTAVNDRLDHMGRSYLSLFMGLAYSGYFSVSRKAR
jgi:O-antigen ligase